MNHRDVWVVLTWSPKNDNLAYNLQARTLMAEAALYFPAHGLKLINSVAHQKSMAKARAFQWWEAPY